MTAETASVSLDALDVALARPLLPWTGTGGGWPLPCSGCCQPANR